ncbi:uncharacterized protein LOC126802310 [Argentina anserina]|uniref:uncharacterized protein LOC126802310 n=1 Tax=Argentina anserina TaxID=57926 RepID=UPI002176436F|nr:uncharacterized protein LOC126802310 [Potentilla anserina]
MASSGFPDIFSWIQSLPPISQWPPNNSIVSISLCSSSSSSQPSLKLCISKNPQAPTLYFSVVADYNLPVALWTSKHFKYSPNNITPISQETISSLLVNVIESVIHYGSNKNSFLIKFLKLEYIANLEEVFNLSFLTLLFLVCIYEAPAGLRSGCLNILKNHLADCCSRQTSKSLMMLLGSNLEEEWMRSMNLAITNWTVELQAEHRTVKTPSPLYSYAISTFGMLKVQLYCPVIAMDIEKSSSPSCDDERLQFSLNYHQLEGVLQFNYKVIVKERWIDVMLNVDNIRCDIVRLVNETLMKEQGAGTGEKHFPSRISLQITPTRQSNIVSVSVSKSSDNPAREIGKEKGIEGSFEPPNPYVAIRVSAGETMTMSLKPWKFEESVYGYSAKLNWFLHDSVDGREIFSSKPSKYQLINPKAWFKDRYSSAYRPFTRQGGVIFAGDEYGEGVMWKVDKAALGKTMEWEIRGWIWLTYWPNKHRTCYAETRRLEFREILKLTIA